MNKFKITFAICAALVTLIAFQNCGKTKSATSPNGNESESTLIVQPVPKAIAHYLMSVDIVSSELAELKEDGSVENVNTGAIYAIDPALQNELREALATAEVCSYKIQEPANSQIAHCMALALPHAFAIAEDGEEFQLSVSMCGADTFDLCQSSRDEFAKLVSRVRAAIRPPSP